MQEKAVVYLDSNAGAPLQPAVLEALQHYFSFTGQSLKVVPNPSSIHSVGRQGKRILAQAREQVAASIGASDAEQVLWTSSGTEANQLAIRSALQPKFLKGEKVHWLTTAVEHDSNRQMVAWAIQNGAEVDFLPLDAEGVPQTQRWQEFVRPHTALVSVLWVNNETGVVTDLAPLAAIQGTPVHVDAAQAWGKLPLTVETLGVQWVTFSGHKIGGLAGTGVLWSKKGENKAPTYPLAPVILGKQEKGRRGGTENVIGALALGTAAQGIDPLDFEVKVRPLRERLQAEICARIPGTRVNGGGAQRVANTLNLSFDQVEGDGLVMALDRAGYCVSSGSACASGVLEPSHVLLAMGRTRTQSTAALRISLSSGEKNWDMLEGFIQALEKIVIRVRTARSFKS